MPNWCAGHTLRGQLLFGSQMNMKTLEETEFMRTLANMAGALLKDTVSWTRPRIGHFTRPFTEQEEYLSECMILAGQISTACDQLYYALAYLSGYRSRRTSDGELITRADHLAYQMENLYLRLGMIPDRSLRLTNEVLRLGLPARECRTRTVADNRHLRGTPVRAHLRAIDKIVEPHREARNTIVHSARYNDPALANVEAFFVLKKSEGPPDESVVERLHHSYKHKTDAYVEAKRKEFAPVVNDLIGEVARLFEALLPAFRREHAALK